VEGTTLIGKIRDERYRIIDLERKYLDRNKKKLKDLQDQCKHPSGNVSYHSDPAGDTSDSFYECSECGFYSKKYPGDKK
jgi:hypothetical protein